MAAAPLNHKCPPLTSSVYPSMARDIACKMSLGATFLLNQINTGAKSRQNRAMRTTLHEGDDQIA